MLSKTMASCIIYSLVIVDLTEPMAIECKDYTFKHYNIANGTVTPIRCSVVCSQSDEFCQEKCRDYWNHCINNVTGSTTTVSFLSSEGSPSVWLIVLIVVLIIFMCVVIFVGSRCCKLRRRCRLLISVPGKAAGFPSEERSLRIRDCENGGRRDLLRGRRFCGNEDVDETEIVYAELSSFSLPDYPHRLLATSTRAEISKVSEENLSFIVENDDVIKKEIDPTGQSPEEANESIKENNRFEDSGYNVEGQLGFLCYSETKRLTVAMSDANYSEEIEVNGSEWLQIDGSDYATTSTKHSQQPYSLSPDIGGKARDETPPVDSNSSRAEISKVSEEHLSSIVENDDVAKKEIDPTGQSPGEANESIKENNRFEDSGYNVEGQLGFLCYSETKRLTVAMSDANYSEEIEVNGSEWLQIDGSDYATTSTKHSQQPYSLSPDIGGKARDETPPVDSNSSRAEISKVSEEHLSSIVENDDVAKKEIDPTGQSPGEANESLQIDGSDYASGIGLQSQQTSPKHSQQPYSLTPDVGGKARDETTPVDSNSSTQLSIGGGCEVSDGCEKARNISPGDEDASNENETICNDTDLKQLNPDEHSETDRDHQANTECSAQYEIANYIEPIGTPKPPKSHSCPQEHFRQEKATTEAENGINYAVVVPESSATTVEFNGLTIRRAACTSPESDPVLKIGLNPIGWDLHWLESEDVPLSYVLHCLPHGETFQNLVKVKMRLNRKAEGPLTVWYTATDNGQDTRWQKVGELTIAQRRIVLNDGLDGNHNEAVLFPDMGQVEFHLHHFCSFVITERKGFERKGCKAVMRLLIGYIADKEGNKSIINIVSMVAINIDIMTAKTESLQRHGYKIEGDYDFLLFDKTARLAVFVDDVNYADQCEVRRPGWDFQLESVRHEILESKTFIVTTQAHPYPGHFEATIHVLQDRNETATWTISTDLVKMMCTMSRPADCPKCFNRQHQQPKQQQQQYPMEFAAIHNISNRTPCRTRTNSSESSQIFCFCSNRSDRDDCSYQTDTKTDDRAQYEKRVIDGDELLFKSDGPQCESNLYDPRLELLCEYSRNDEVDRNRSGAGVHKDTEIGQGAWKELLATSLTSSHDPAYSKVTRVAGVHESFKTDETSCETNV